MASNNGNISLYSCNSGDTTDTGFNMAQAISNHTGLVTMGAIGEIVCSINADGTADIKFPTGKKNFRPE